MATIDRALAEGILFTDFYQLTMAQVYFNLGIHDTPSRFEYFFRSYPDYGQHQAGYCISAGLEWFLDWYFSANFGKKECDFLSCLKDKHGKHLFSSEFIKWISQIRTFYGMNISAIPEGRVIHPNEPLMMVEGPLAMAQLVESALLNHMNYQTLVATKASRIRESGLGQITLEFGLRRAQDRAASAGARAAVIGGATGTSHTGLSAIIGKNPSGTHAHSMVQAIIALGGTELDAFRAYADLYPDNCILLVDTIDTLGSGLPNAIKVFQELKDKGHEPVGVRLDSGDLAYLSILSAQMLDHAGFSDALIVLSNNLDELVIWQIITQIRIEAERYEVDPEKLIRRLAYGVGTRLITSGGDSALDGVYKLVAVKHNNQWAASMKISENPEKTLNPGSKKLWRLYDEREKAIADLIASDDEKPSEMDVIELHHPSDHSKFRNLAQQDISRIEALQVDIIKNDMRTCAIEGLDAIQKRRDHDLECLYPGVKRLMNPHTYHVSLSRKLWDLKQQLSNEILQSK